MLLSPIGQRSLEQAAVGTTRAEVSIGVLRRLRLLVPPLGEQQKIVDVLSAEDCYIDAEDAYLTKLKQLKAALMDDLLTGRVRVPVAEEVAV
jgi:type I restriction enzyme S subunit